MISKKNLSLLISLIIIMGLSYGFSYSEKLDFKTEITKISGNKIDILITVTSGEPEFTYSIWEGEPWEDGHEIENSGKTNSTEYIFRNLDAKPYFILVADKDGLRRVKQIELMAAIQIKTD